MEDKQYNFFIDFGEDMLVCIHIILSVKHFYFLFLVEINPKLYSVINDHIYRSTLTRRWNIYWTSSYFLVCTVHSLTLYMQTSCSCHGNQKYPIVSGNIELHLHYTKTCPSPKYTNRSNIWNLNNLCVFNLLKINYKARIMP